MHKASKKIKLPVLPAWVSPAVCMFEVQLWNISMACAGTTLPLSWRGRVLRQPSRQPKILLNLKHLNKLWAKDTGLSGRENQILGPLSSCSMPAEVPDSQKGSSLEHSSPLNKRLPTLIWLWSRWDPSSYVASKGRFFSVFLLQYVSPDTQ